MKKQRKNEHMSAPLKGKTILLGICGGIAAYKMPELVRALRKAQAEVVCLVTENGLRFVTALTLKTLSNNRVYTDMFDDSVWDIEHISLAKKSDLIVVAPATADAIARFAAGRAEDLLSSVILAARSPVLVCPAMNDKMWSHPATRANVERLKEYGYNFEGPQNGQLACGDTGMGKLSEIDDIVSKITAILK
jgi:phosphopantothenoylcysteine synthetase/decarboxylase